MSKKSAKDEMVFMLQKKNKELEDQIKKMRLQNEDLRKIETDSEAKVKALNEVHSQKTKALLKSINMLKKEIQKIKFEQKDNVRHKMNERLQDDIKLQEVAINVLRRVVGDEDACNKAIKKELEKGPLRVRVLSREELKMEIKKYKNISLRIVKDFQKTGNKVPSYVSGLVKESAAGGLGEGLKKEKSDAGFDGDSMFEVQSELPQDEEIPEKFQQKIEKLEDQIVKLNVSLKDKNEKILELLNELEEVKIQVYAAEKANRFQEKQIDDLMKERSKSKAELTQMK